MKPKCVYDSVHGEYVMLEAALPWSRLPASYDAGCTVTYQTVHTERLLYIDTFHKNLHTLSSFSLAQYRHGAMDGAIEDVLRKRVKAFTRKVPDCELCRFDQFPNTLFFILLIRSPFDAFYQKALMTEEAWKEGSRGRSYEDFLRHYANWVAGAHRNTEVAQVRM